MSNGGPGSQAEAQAEIDKQKAANQDITNWQDNIIGAGTDQGTITASGRRKNKSNLPVVNWDEAWARAQRLGYVKPGETREQWRARADEWNRGKKVDLSANWNNSSVVTTPTTPTTPTNPTNTPPGGGPNNQGGGSGASSQSGVTVNNYTGNNPATSTPPRPTNPAGGKNIDEMLGRQPKPNTFKKTTGLPDAGRGSKTPYKFRGLENQFQSWQMQHYNNQDTTT